MNFSKIPVKNFQLWKKRNRKLSKEAKIIYLFLFSSPLTSMSGIFEMPELSKTGLNQKEIKTGLQQLIKKGLVILDEENEIIAVPEMIKINEPKGSKQESGYFKYIDEIEDFEKWDIVISYMVSIGYNENVIGYLRGIDRVSIGYARGIDTVYDSVSIQVEEEVEEEDKSRSKKIEVEKKEKDDSASKDALDIYNFYKLNIKSGERKKALDRLPKILSKHSKDELLQSISNYITSKQGETNMKYYKAAGNFFNAVEGFYYDFLPSEYAQVQQQTEKEKAMQKEIAELKMRSCNFEYGEWTDYGLLKLEQVKARYNSNIIEAEFKVVGGKNEFNF